MCIFDHDDRITVPTDLAELQQMLESIEPGSTHGFMSFLTDVYKKNMKLHVAIS